MPFRFIQLHSFPKSFPNGVTCVLVHLTSFPQILSHPSVTPTLSGKSQFFFLLQLCCPIGTSPMGKSGCFPREKLAATESRYLTYRSCGVFYCFHNSSNSDMDYRIFNARTDVNARDCTCRCTDTVRESALKVDSERKQNPLPPPGNRTCLSDVPVPRSTNWATSPPQLSPKAHLRVVGM